MRIVSLKEDYVFKEFMSNEVVRKYFLSATLGVPVESIRSVRLVNSFLSRKWRMQKQGILDVQIEFNDDTKVNLEMQVAKQRNWKKRNVFYLAKMYTEDIRWGEDYENLRRCIGISILDYNLTEEPYGHHIYRMRDHEGRDFTDLLELHIIELKKNFSSEDSLADWVKLFNATTEEELDMIKSSNIGIRTGMKMLREMSLTRRIRYEIEAREKARRDHVAEMQYLQDEAMEKGMAKGLEQGLEQGLEKGLEQGLEQGQKMMNSLYAKLLEDNRGEDMKRALKDVEYQRHLMEEYHIK